MPDRRPNDYLTVEFHPDGTVRTAIEHVHGDKTPNEVIVTWLRTFADLLETNKQPIHERPEWKSPSNISAVSSWNPPPSQTYDLNGFNKETTFND